MTVQEIVKSVYPKAYCYHRDKGDEKWLICDGTEIDSLIAWSESNELHAWHVAANKIQETQTTTPCN